MDSPPAKRKRTPSVELEIDLALPEPASKKAKRAEKKSKSTPKPKPQAKRPDPELLAGTPPPNPQQPTKRSEHSIWIGNLPFTATKDTLRNFLQSEGSIASNEIVRLHLPITTSEDFAKKKITQNKGFAYIDFTTPEGVSKALAISERLFEGKRRVLVKDAKSFEGRPVKKPEPATQNGQDGKKAPSKRIFVGNLGFDVEKEEIETLFAPAGEVEDVFLATFEDSGKCKGFGWVRFGDIEAASKAVRGYVVEGDDQDEGVKKRKRWCNRLHGRQIRCEFAEDKVTRYKKRFTKDVSKNNDDVKEAAGGSEVNAKINAEQRREVRRKRHEKLAAKHAGREISKKESGGIVASAGSKTTFED